MSIVGNAWELSNVGPVLHISPALVQFFVFVVQGLSWGGGGGVKGENFRLKKSEAQGGGGAIDVISPLLFLSI